MANERHYELVARGREIVQKAPWAFISLDVEADGPAGVGSLLSVGAVSSWGDDFYRELRPTDKPGTPSSIQFCEEHGLTRKRLLKEGKRPAQVMKDLSAWVQKIVTHQGKSGAILVAFPSWFDFGHINVAMIENGVTNPFGLNGFCVQSLALALDSSYNWDGVSMKNLPPEIVPAREFTHHALEDAAFQQEMYFALIALLEEQRQK